MLGIVLKHVYPFIDPATVAFFRLASASTLLAIYFFLFQRQELKTIRRLPKTVFIASLGLAINYLGYAYGVQLTSASNSQVFIQLGPILLLLSSLFIFKDPASPLQLFGIAVSSLGFALFFFDQFHQPNIDMAAYLKGNLWIVIGSITWVFWAFIQKKLSKEFHPQLLNMLIYAGCALLILPFAKVETFQSLTPSLWGWLIFLGLNTLFGYGAFAVALQKIPAYQVSLITSSNPILTLLLIYLIQDGTLSVRGYTGAGLVIAGILLSIKR